MGRGSAGLPSLGSSGRVLTGGIRVLSLVSVSKVCDVLLSSVLQFNGSFVVVSLPDCVWVSSVVDDISFDMFSPKMRESTG